ncbi:protein of unknown function [Enterobacter cancerogenus]|nr:protein of unknown function [Enterobacter cancerogenus]
MKMVEHLHAANHKATNQELNMFAHHLLLAS